MDGARAVLRSKGIQFQEKTETSQAVLLDRQDKSIPAAAGDRVISARLETEASQFPFGFDIEVILLFGPDDRLKDQYVHRLRSFPQQIPFQRRAMTLAMRWRALDSELTSTPSGCYTYGCTSATAEQLSIRTVQVLNCQISMPLDCPAHTKLLQ
jgi:hypothetical protein